MAVLEAELLQARQFLESQDAYVAPTVINGRAMEGCIDPRPDANTSTQWAKITGPGATVGTSSDAALVRTIEEGRYVSLTSAAMGEVGSNPNISGAHFSVCAYAAGYKTVLAEVAHPSDATKEKAESWAVEMNLGDLFAPGSQAGAISDAAKMHVDELARHGHTGTGPVTNLINGSYAGKNVPEMVDPANPGLYTVSLLPKGTLNREVYHRDHTMQTYFDSLGMRIDMLERRSMDVHTRALRAAATILRSAATNTVINEMKAAEGNPLVNLKVVARAHVSEF